MMVHEDDLYIFGRFSFAGEDTAISAAKWDGTKFTSLGFPFVVGPGSPPLIIDAAVYNGDIYVGGQFGTGNTGPEQIDIARFDGQNWYPVAGGTKGTIGDVDAVVVYKDELYIGGNFRKSNGNAGNGIMRLKGDQWVDVGGSFDEATAVVQDMAIYHDELYVFGSFNYVGGGLRASNVAKWDGEKWCGLGSVFERRIELAEVFKDTIFVGGWFRTIDGDSITYIAKWSGDFVDTCGAIISSEVHRLENKHLHITPNPTPSPLTIENTTLLPYRAAVFDVTGREVFRFQSDGREARRELDLGGVAKGVYFLRFDSDGHRWTERVIKL